MKRAYCKPKIVKAQVTLLAVTAVTASGSTVNGVGA